MESYVITVQSTGNAFTCRDDQSVLDAMLKAGCGPYHYGCYGGGCGVCKIQVLEGDYHCFKNMSRAHIKEGEMNQGFVLSCCIQPRSDLVIEGIAPAH